MAITHFGNKMLRGTKSDRKSDSLGSSADGTNSGITLASGKEITWTSSGSTTTFNSVTKSASSAGWTNNYAYSQSYSSGILIVEFDPNVGQGYGSLCGIDDGTNHTDPTDITLGMAGLTQATNNNTIISGTATDQGSGSWAAGDTMKIEYNIDSGAYAFYRNGSAISGVSGTLTGGAKPSSVRVLVSSYNQNYKVTDIAISGSATTSTATLQKLGTGAYEFDGSNDYVQIGSSATDFKFFSDNSSAYSLCFWLKPDQTSSDVMLFNNNASTNTNVGIQLMQLGANIRMRVGGDSSGDVWTMTESSAVTTGEWSHWALTWDKTTARMYKNGVEVETATKISGRSFSTSNPLNTGLRIGADSNSGSSNYDGMMDDIGIYKRKLTATEIEKLANNNDDGTTGWTFKTGGTASYAIDDGKLKLSPDNSGSTTGNAKAAVATYDLYSALGNSNLANTWVLRATVDTVFNISGNDAGMVWNVGCCDSPASTFTTNQDENGTVQSIQGLRGGTGNSGGYQYHLITSWQPSQADNNSTTISSSSNTNETKYIEVIRTSVSSASVKIYSNSDYSDTPTTISISSFTQNPANLRYIFARAHQKKSTVANYGRVYDIKLWNNTTTASGTATVTVPNPTVGDAQLVSSLTDKSNLKAHYSMDTETTASQGASYVYGSTAGNSGAIATKSLGLTLGTTWCARFEYTPVSTDNAIYSWVVTDNAQQVNSNDKGYGIKGNQASQITLFSATGSSSLTQASQGYITGLSANTTYYCEIINDDTNISLKMYTGSDFSTGLVNSTTRTVSDQGWTDLDTLMFSGRSDAGSGTTYQSRMGATQIWNNQTTATGTADYTEDYTGWTLGTGYSITQGKKCPNDFSSTSDLEAMTNLPENTLFLQTDNTPSYWWYNGTSWLLDGSFATYTDDLTSDKGWTSNTSDWTYNASDYLDFATIRRSTTSQEMYIDVQEKYGVTLDSSKWTLRLGKFTTGALASSGNVMFFFGLTNDKDADSGQTQQSVLANLNFSPSEGGIFLYCTTGNLESGSNRVTGTVYDGLVASTDYWIEISRDGDVFTAKAYSDEYSTEIGSKSLTKTGISGLRYLKVLNDSEQNGNTATGTKLYGKIEIANGKAGWLS